MQGTLTDTIFYIIVLIFSIVVHEVSHGLMAQRLGDKTAEYEGRLTLNPIPHIDLVGSIILPLILILSGSPILVGWAKPVPYNPYNFYDKPWIKKWGEALVAIAGPASNIAIALFFGLFLRFFNLLPAATPLIQTIILVNIVLATFNLVPLPPLDGSKILFAFFPLPWARFRFLLEKHSLVISLIFILFLWQFFSPLIFIIYRFIVGA